MRHLKKTLKLGRTGAHRDAMLANQVCSLIRERRIKTTLPKAKATRILAEKMVTLGKKGTLAARRKALSTLHNEDAVKTLFANIAPVFTNRSGGYTRITKLGPRQSDASEMAILEWVDAAEPVENEK
jgi:large subunit ribosomal protein L17